MHHHRRVHAGENRGTLLKHDHVVRAFAGPLDPTQADAEIAVAADVALGFRVKSGWALAVLVTGSRDDVQVRQRQRIELSDAKVPESYQPYHAGMGNLQTDETKIKRLRKLISAATTHSFSRLIKECSDGGHHIGAVGLVVGSDIDPDRITNPHIRAHALEGRLFRTSDLLRQQPRQDIIGRARRARNDDLDCFGWFGTARMVRSDGAHHVL